MTTAATGTLGLAKRVDQISRCISSLLLLFLVFLFHINSLPLSYTLHSISTCLIVYFFSSHTTNTAAAQLTRRQLVHSKQSGHNHGKHGSSMCISGVIILITSKSLLRLRTDSFCCHQFCCPAAYFLSSLHPLSCGDRLGSTLLYLIFPGTLTLPQICAAHVTLEHEAATTIVHCCYQ